MPHKSCHKNIYKNILITYNLIKLLHGDAYWHNKDNPCEKPIHNYNLKIKSIFFKEWFSNFL